MLDQKGFTIWYTGLAGAGKTALSNVVHRRLKDEGITNVEVLDGDDVTSHLSKGLGFTREDIDTNILRIGWVAHVLTKHRVPNLVSAISPYRETRDEVRRMVELVGGKGSFIEVFVDCPVEVCEARDTSGLYAKARKGELKHLTGINEPYEKPHNPEVHIDSGRLSSGEGADIVLEHLRSKGLIK